MYAGRDRPVTLTPYPADRSRHRPRVRVCRVDAPLVRHRDRALLPGSRLPLDSGQAHARAL